MRVSGFRSFTRSLVISSVRTAKTGFSFALGFLPRSPIDSRIWRLTDRDVARGRQFARPVPEPAPNGNEPPVEFAEATLTLTTECGSRVSRMEELRFIKLSEKATLPTRAHDNDAGLDLYSAEAALIKP